MTRMSFLVAAVTTGVAAMVIAVAAACGGGGGGGDKTPAATTTPSDHGTPDAMASPATQEELQTAFETARTQLQEVISKAQGGDLQGAQDAYKPADDPLHMIEDALQAQGDADLADSIEAKQHDGIEDPLDSGNADLAAIAQAAQDILPLLDQAAAKLGITAGGLDRAALSDDLKTLKAVMEETLAKANAGDVTGTQEAEGKGDEAIEALIDAVRTVDPALADSVEQLELDYEGQADSANPDLTVIANDAQSVLDLLDDVAAALGISQ